MSRQPRDNKLKRELDFILDIPLDVSAELGRTRLLINELLQLGQGPLHGVGVDPCLSGQFPHRGQAAPWWIDPGDDSPGELLR